MTNQELKDRIINEAILAFHEAESWDSMADKQTTKNMKDDCIRRRIKYTQTWGRFFSIIEDMGWVKEYHNLLWKDK